MRIQDVTKLTGINKRTLHHYDHIGLLSPKKDAHSGYRSYSDQDLDRLQSILFYKALGLSLDTIKNLLNKSQDRLITLEKQKLDLLKNKHNLIK